MVRSGLATVSAFVIVALGAPALPAHASIPSTSSVTHVDGIYRIVSTDCYFAAGRCRARFDIEQKGTKLFDPGDRYFRGHVQAEHVDVSEVYPAGTSEDSWWATGVTNDGGRTFSGTFSDGIGGSGTFKATRLGPG